MSKLICFAFAAMVLSVAPGRAEVTLRLVEVLPSPVRSEALEALVAEFEGRHAGTRVEVVSLSWDHAFERLAVMVEAGDAPDVVEMPDRWLSTYAAPGRLENLDPFLRGWRDSAALDDRTLAAARAVGGKAYVLPYGFYLRALFYNKAVFREAGIADPPRTLDDFVAVARRISALPGRSGYCLRGGPGGLSAWLMFGATMAGSAAVFDAEGRSTLSQPGWVAGSSFVVDLYAGGAAPRDSVNWGFTEVLSGFATGRCAMLDQDPDALSALAGAMPRDDIGVTAMPKGPSGRAFPTLGYAGWSMFAASRHKDLAWDLIATLGGQAGSAAWNRGTGLLPVYRSAQDDPALSDGPLGPWIQELRDPGVTPLVLPTALPHFGHFADVVAVETGQQALLGRITPQALNDRWAETLDRDRAARVP